MSASGQQKQIREKPTETEEIDEKKEEVTQEKPSSSALDILKLAIKVRKNYILLKRLNNTVLSGITPAQLVRTLTNIIFCLAKESANLSVPSPAQNKALFVIEQALLYLEEDIKKVNSQIKGKEEDEENKENEKKKVKSIAEKGVEVADTSIDFLQHINALTACALHFPKPGPFVRAHPAIRKAATYYNFRNLKNTLTNLPKEIKNAALKLKNQLDFKIGFYKTIEEALKLVEEKYKSAKDEDEIKRLQVAKERLNKIKYHRGKTLKVVHPDQMRDLSYILYDYYDIFGNEKKDFPEPKPVDITKTDTADSSQADTKKEQPSKPSLIMQFDELVETKAPPLLAAYYLPAPMIEIEYYDIDLAIQKGINDYYEDAVKKADEELEKLQMDIESDKNRIKQLEDERMDALTLQKKEDKLKYEQSQNNKRLKEIEVEKKEIEKKKNEKKKNKKSDKLKAEEDKLKINNQEIQDKLDKVAALPDLNKKVEALKKRVLENKKSHETKQVGKETLAQNIQSDIVIVAKKVYSDIYRFGKDIKNYIKKKVSKPKDNEVKDEYPKLPEVKLNLPKNTKTVFQTAAIINRLIEENGYDRTITLSSNEPRYVHKPLMDRKFELDKCLSDLLRTQDKTNLKAANDAVICLYMTLLSTMSPERREANQAQLYLLWNVLSQNSTLLKDGRMLLLAKAYAYSDGGHPRKASALMFAAIELHKSLESTKKEDTQEFTKSDIDRMLNSAMKKMIANQPGGKTYNDSHKLSFHSKLFDKTFTFSLGPISRDLLLKRNLKKRLKQAIANQHIKINPTVIDKNAEKEKTKGRFDNDVCKDLADIIINMQECMKKHIQSEIEELSKEGLLEEEEQKQLQEMKDKLTDMEKALRAIAKNLKNLETLKNNNPSANKEKFFQEFITCYQAMIKYQDDLNESFTIAVDYLWSYVKEMDPHKNAMGELYLLRLAHDKREKDESLSLALIELASAVNDIKMKPLEEARPHLASTIIKNVLDKLQKNDSQSFTEKLQEKILKPKLHVALIKAAAADNTLKDMITTDSILRISYEAQDDRKSTTPPSN